MTDRIDKRLEELGYSWPKEMIELLETRLDRLQKIVDEADTTEKKLNDKIRALRAKKRRLKYRIKAGQVPETTQLPESTRQPPMQPAQGRKRSRTRR
jgi:hypothetical protein